MNNKEILANAPSGATHIDGEGDFCKEGYFYWCTRRNYGDHPEAWIPDEFIVGNRSLADIRRIVELENIINAQVFPSSGDGFSSEYIKGYEKALSDLDKILKEQE
jgi:hypothetical protein